MARNKAFDESTVLNKAMEVFWEKGYCATSMQDLVDGMGINRASLYDTFGDKQQLFIETLNNYRSQQARTVVEMLETAPSVKDALQNLLRGVLQDALCDQDKGCFMVNAAIEFATRDAAVLQIIRQNIQTIENALSVAITKGQSTGEIKTSQSPEALAKFLVNTVNGMRVAEKAGYESAHFEAIISVVERVLFE